MCLVLHRHLLNITLMQIASGVLPCAKHHFSICILPVIPDKIRLLWETHLSVLQVYMVAQIARKLSVPAIML